VSMHLDKIIIRLLIHKILHLASEPGSIQILNHSGILDLIHGQFNVNSP
jgi:hypothetical protein